jgi:hypothetical protein
METATPKIQMRDKIVKKRSVNTLTIEPVYTEKNKSIAITLCPSLNGIYRRSIQITVLSKFVKLSR